MIMRGICFFVVHYYKIAGGAGRKASIRIGEHYLGPEIAASRGVAAKQGFLMYYSKGDAIGTKVSVRYRRSGRLSEVVVKRGSTVYDVSFALLRAHSVNAHAQLFCSRALVVTPLVESQEQELKACACSYVCIML